MHCGIMINTMHTSILCKKYLFITSYSIFSPHSLLILKVTEVLLNIWVIRFTFLGLIMDSVRFSRNKVPRFMDFQHCTTVDGKYFCPNSPDRIYKNKRNLKRHLKELLEITTKCHLCGNVLESRDDLFLHLHKQHTPASIPGCSQYNWCW